MGTENEKRAASIWKISERSVSSVCDAKEGGNLVCEAEREAFPLVGDRKSLLENGETEMRIRNSDMESDQKNGTAFAEISGLSRYMLSDQFAVLLLFSARMRSA